MDKSEGEVSRFISKFFCLTLSKTAVGELFSLSLFSGIEKVRMGDWGLGGGASVMIFRRKIFVSQCSKFRRVTHLCYVSEIFR